MSEKLILELDSSNKVEVYLHGATITSWICKGREILFLSSKSIFDNKKAIRGGIPIVFPNFGPWEKGPQHGFARIKKWSLKEPIHKTNDCVSAKLYLLDDDETRKMWDYKFELVYDIVLRKDSLSSNLTVTNLDSNEFDFTSLLHTYFKIEDINKVKVENFNGLTYIDKVKGGSIEKESQDFLTISQEIDRVYISTSNSHIIHSNNDKITLTKHNLPDTVVWNPWIEKSKSMTDFADEEYNQMICVEAGYVNSRYTLKPSQQLTMGQNIYV